MSSQLIIREALQALLLTVPNIGSVHKFERYANRNSEFKAFYEAQVNGQKQIRGWYISLKKRKSTSQITGVFHNRDFWLVRGYMSVSDESETELELDDLVEQLIQLIKQNDSLGGVVDTCIDDQANTAGLQLEESGHVMLSGVLCHDRILTLTTRSTEQLNQ